VLFFTMLGVVGAFLFIASAITNQPDGGVISFLLVIFCIKMVFWLLDSLVETMER